MRGMKSVVRLCLVPLCLLTISAAPSAKLIPVGNYGEAIMIPANSTLRFQRLKHDDRASFSGRVEIEGIWVIDCEWCGPGQKDNELHLSIIPNPATIARLPRWKYHSNDIRIDLWDADHFIRSVSTANERRQLLAGKLQEIRGHAKLVIDRYEAALECDSASYSARFVAVTQVARRANIPTDGSYGCGYAQLGLGAARRTTGL